MLGRIIFCYAELTVLGLVGGAIYVYGLEACGYPPRGAASRAPKKEPMVENPNSP